jgi:type II secretory pathway predicted ATPase ExeA
MQVSKRVVRQLKVQMKASFPGEYALVVVEKLRQQGILVSTQQVYNFFNNVSVNKQPEIKQAAEQLIKEAKERDTQVAAILKEALIQNPKTEEPWN